MFHKEFVHGLQPWTVGEQNPQGSKNRRKGENNSLGFSPCFQKKKMSCFY